MSQDLLFINVDDLVNKVNIAFDGLNESMGTDSNFTNNFISNPASAFSQILPEHITNSEQNLSSVNRFLFSVFSNDAFMGWLGSYQNDLIQAVQDPVNNPISKKSVLRNFSDALLQYGTRELMYSVLDVSTIGKPAQPSASLNGPPGGIGSFGGPPTPPSPGDDDDADDILVVILIFVVILFIMFLFFMVGFPGFITLTPGVPVTSQDFISLAEQLTLHAQKLKDEGKLIDISNTFTQSSVPPTNNQSHQ